MLTPEMSEGEYRDFEADFVAYRPDPSGLTQLAGYAVGATDARL